MLKEALDFLTDQATKARGARVVQVPEPKHKYIVEAADGELEWHESDPEPRNHKARDLSAILAFAEANAESKIWYSRSGVVCVVDDKTRRDKVTLALSPSPQVEALRKMEQSREPIEQADLVLLLRTTFAGSVSPPNFLSIIKTLKFNRQEDGETEIDHGKASLGKNIKLGLTSGEKIPEEITFTVPIFANAFFMMSPVRAAVHIDAAEETFTIIPLPLEIERAVIKAETMICTDIGDRPGVHYGEPV